jgi:hypothetical protein
VCLIPGLFVLVGLGSYFDDEERFLISFGDSCFTWAVGLGLLLSSFFA